MRCGFLAVLLACAPLAAAADPPRAEIHFIIEAKQFVDGLQSNRKSVERAITQQLLDECRSQKSFPFITWVTGDPAVVNTLEVALVERPAGGDVETLLEFRGKTKDGAMPPALQQVVYRWFQPKNADSAAVVKNHLRDAIRQLFGKEQFRSNLLHYFVSRVPLAETVTVDPPAQRIIVPFPAETLQADERESELAVSFFGKNDGRPGRMTLMKLIETPPRGVSGYVKEFDFISAPLSGWSEHIPQVLAPSKIRDVRVMMTVYVPRWFSGVHEGSLTND